MREVSIDYLDAANDAKDRLLALSILLSGLGLVCRDLEGPNGLKEALFMLSQSCDEGASQMEQLWGEFRR